VSNRRLALAHQEADVAVRIGRPTEAAVVARRVGDLQVGLYATPELLDQYGVPATADDLSRFSLIGPDRNLTEIAFLCEQGFDCTSNRVAIRTDEHLAQLASLRAGLGIGVCAGQLAHGHGLVRVLPEQVNFSIDVWIAMHEDLRRVQRVALVFDALGESLKAFLQT